jgi:hypothetical protein
MTSELTEPAPIKALFFIMGDALQLEHTLAEGITTPSDIGMMLLLLLRRATRKEFIFRVSTEDACSKSVQIHP